MSGPDQVQAAPTTSLWRHHDFMLLWAGQTISDIGSAVTILALPLVALSALHVSTASVGLLAAAGSAAYLLVALPAGVVVDRLPKYRIMLWCNASRGLILATIPIAAFTGHLSMALLYFAAFTTGAFTVFFEVAYQSFVPTLLGREQLVDGNGKLATTNALSAVVGPTLAGLLVTAFGQAARAIIADCLSFLVSIGTLLLIRTKERPTARPDTPRAGTFRQIGEGLSFIANHRVLRRVVACAAVSTLFNSVLILLIVVFLVRDLHAAPSLIGLTLGVGSAGGVVGGLIAGPLARRIGSARLLWLGKLSLGWLALLIPLARPGWSTALVPLGLFAVTTSLVMFNVSQVSYRQSVCPPELLGRMNASIRWVIRGAQPLGSLLGGVLGGWLGVRPTLLVAALGSWLAVLWIVASPLRGMREIPTHEAYAR